jgi:hypothetical protein
VQIRSTKVAPALEALLEGFIDYAGVFPPATLSLQQAVDSFEDYSKSEYSWMLHSLVVGVNVLAQVPHSLDGRLAVLSDVDEARASSIEAKNVVSAKCPVYVEVPLDQLNLLDVVKQSGCRAKIRTGGVKPEAIPSCAQVAEFILRCAERQLAFKATAGLHHPIRAEYALSYEHNAPRAVMHGFINILMAAAFAFHGEKQIEEIIAETEAAAFSFSETACWRNKSLTVEQLQDARSNFIHSVGSCSFEEPVQDLQKLGLLPQYS